MKKQDYIYGIALGIVMLSQAVLMAREYKPYTKDETVVHEITTKLINKTDYFLSFEADAESTWPGSAGGYIYIGEEQNSYTSPGYAPGSGAHTHAKISYEYPHERGQSGIYTCEFELNADSLSKENEMQPVTYEHDCSKLKISVLAQPVKMYYVPSTNFPNGSTYKYYNYTITVSKP